MSGHHLGDRGLSFFLAVAYFLRGGIVCFLSRLQLKFYLFQCFSSRYAALTVFIVCFFNEWSSFRG